MLDSTSTVLPCVHERDGGREMTHAAIDLYDLEAPQSAARHIVRTTLARMADKADGEYTDDVVLVADELVGNAVEHAGAALDISLDVYDWGVTIQVRDSGEDTTAVPGTPPAADDYDEGGRGLFLVDILASAWGVQRDKKGKRVIAIFLYQAGEADR
ncbi:ATP-binding protein [Streptomyces sp. NPDC086080]|uniref:ATP-binding protein n=1 Tax=unclassified Streptomyces TaxID=2593676 RepID=UPI0033DDACBB